MSVWKKYPRAFTVRAADASVMDVPAALVYGPGTALPACIAVTQLFLYSTTWQTDSNACGMADPARKSALRCAVKRG